SGWSRSSRAWRKSKRTRTRTEDRSPLSAAISPDKGRVLLRRVDAGGGVGVVAEGDDDVVAVLEGAELFQLLGLFEGRRRERAVGVEEVAPIDVEADVAEVRHAAGGVAVVRDDGAREVQGAPIGAAHDLHNVGVARGFR